MMTNKRLVSEAPARPSSDAFCVALRSACCFSTVLLFCGCSTPQPIPPKEAPPPVRTAVSVPIAEKISPPAREEETTAPVSDENNVFFALRSATVEALEKEKLRQHAERLKMNRKERVLLIGHNDDQGSRNYNLAITEERLTVVQKLLRSYGVSARQIRRNRSGSVKARPPCATKACQQQMRRVELVYLP